jgi:hypothetical protein
MGDGEDLKNDQPSILVDTILKANNIKIKTRLGTAERGVEKSEEDHDTKKSGSMNSDASSRRGAEPR